MVLSGRFGAQLKDGTVLDLGPDDVYDIPPDHDGYTRATNHVCCWNGRDSRLSRSRAGLHRRILTTLLFTDLVDSTVIAGQLGDGAWRELLSGHFELARAQIERFGGREVKTTGDGLATFAGPAQALQCAAAICRAANREASTSVQACTSGRSSWSAPMSEASHA